MYKRIYRPSFPLLSTKERIYRITYTTFRYLYRYHLTSVGTKKILFFTQSSRLYAKRRILKSTSNRPIHYMKLYVSVNNFFRFVKSICYKSTYISLISCFIYRFYRFFLFFRRISPLFFFKLYKNDLWSKYNE